MVAPAPEIKFGDNYRTTQVYSRGFEFAFMSRPENESFYEQATTFVYCKDFLHDAIWAFLNQSKVSIWDFEYDFKLNKPIQMDRTVLAFRNTAYKENPEEFHKQLGVCLEFLQGVDALVGLEPTQIYPIEHAEGPCWLVLADPRWQLAPTLISLFTLLARIGFLHNPGDSIQQTLDRAEKGEIAIGDNKSYAGNRDCSYVKQARKGIDVILKHGLEIFHPTPQENYPPSLIKHRLHDNFGIVNFTQGRPKTVMPYWYREEIWK